MAINLTSAVWDLDIDSTEKMVLMCLCEHANTDGLCWPSVSTIARKCSKSERTVQASLKWLSENQFFTVTDNPGRGRLYRIDPRKICTPAKSAPVQKTASTPAKSAPHPRKICTQTVNEPSRTVNDGANAPSTPAAPAQKKSNARQTLAVDIPDWMPMPEWEAFLEMRQRKRAWPTDYAAKLVVGKLDALRSQGQDPAMVLNQSTLKNWTDIYPLKDSQNGNHNRQADGGASSGYRGPPDRRDGFTRAIHDELERTGAVEPARPAGRYGFGDAAGTGELPLAGPAILR